MARYLGPVCRLCRREGAKLYLKGTKCDTAKCILERRPAPPGMHGHKRGKLSDYGLQLREKQKLKRSTGMLEKQFRLFFKRADRKQGITGENLLNLLNLRLDNVILKAGFATGRRLSRQMLRHGHFLVNGKKVDIPSYILKVGDKIEVKPTGKSKEAVSYNIEKTEYRNVPEWLKVDNKSLSCEVIRMPERLDFEFPVQERMIVELYSK